jgi:hypothetical protein
MERGCKPKGQESSTFSTTFEKHYILSPEGIYITIYVSNNDYPQDERDYSAACAKEQMLDVENLRLRINDCMRCLRCGAQAWINRTLIPHENPETP